MAEILKTDIFPRINELKEKKRNILIGFKECPYCVRAEEILNTKNIEFDYIYRAREEELEEEIKKCYGHETYPMIFINGEFVGGCAELKEKYRC
ncbi:Glutaredoxin [Trachipleistophora hominis]|uniref:Glutaredoxin n=1 Tax=Trachipleistophora hominis TaxID=72359 RepID=L7JYF4_TRAHO|nr:Glutaredoxin [Trachipleistophora hominis]